MSQTHISRCIYFLQSENFFKTLRDIVVASDAILSGPESRFLNELCALFTAS